MSLKAVFIDVGNTLLYEKPSRFEIYAQAARRRGLEVGEAAMRELMRRAHRELPREIEGAYRYSEGWFSFYVARIFHDHLGLSKGELGAVREELFSRFAAAGTFVLHPGATELLTGLRGRGLRVGVVSNWSDRLPLLLDRLGLGPLLDFVLASAIERVEKPEPRIFERALALAGVGAGEALHAGDDLGKDVLAPARLGIQPVLVDHAGTADGSWTGPRARSLFELSDCIARLA